MSFAKLSLIGCVLAGVGCDGLFADLSEVTYEDVQGQDAGGDACLDDSCDEVPDDCVLLVQADLTGQGLELDEPCYETDEILTVVDGTLSVGAGTTIYFGRDAGLEIGSGANLVAIGESDEPVRFRGRDEGKGQWRGVAFRAGGEGENILQNIIIEHGGGDYWDATIPGSMGGVFVDGSRVALEIREAVFRHHRGSALSVVADTRAVEVADTLFEDNGRAMSLKAAQVPGLSGNLEFAGNEEKTVLVSSPGPISGHFSWPGLSTPYEIVGDLEVRGEGIGELANLEIQGGATLLFREGRGLYVGDFAGIRAEGSLRPVVFAGLESQPGYWRGIYVGGSAQAANQLEGVEVSDAGGEGWSDQLRGGLVFTGEMTVIDSRFVGNDVTAINADTSRPLTIDTTEFQNNSRPIRTRFDRLRYIGLDNTFDDQDNSILVTNEAMTTETEVWNVGIPYYIPRVVTVSSPVTIHQGAEFVFGSGAGLSLTGWGRIEAVGTSSSPIVFRGRNGEPGEWHGFYVDLEANAGRVQFTYVHIFHAGIPGAATAPWSHDEVAAITLDGSDLEQAHLTINEIERHGIVLRNGGAVYGCNGLSINTDYQPIYDADTGGQGHCQN